MISQIEHLIGGRRKGNLGAINVPIIYQSHEIESTIEDMRKSFRTTKRGIPLHNQHKNFSIYYLKKKKQWQVRVGTAQNWAFRELYGKLPFSFPFSPSERLLAAQFCRHERQLFSSPHENPLPVLPKCSGKVNFNPIAALCLFCPK